MPASRRTSRTFLEKDMKRTLLAGLMLALTTIAVPAQQSGGTPHHGMTHGQQAQGHQGHGSSPRAGDPPSTAAFRAANDRMHRDMDIQFSGDADIDFIKGMIPHHQGAIDMAKVVLGFGKDAETKKLAEEIIAAQEKEIAFMREWLKKRGQ
jgi:uncharacterized protein (DUF305 family)